MNLKLELKTKKKLTLMYKHKQNIIIKKDEEH